MRECDRTCSSCPDRAVPGSLCSRCLLLAYDKAALLSAHDPWQRRHFAALRNVWSGVGLGTLFSDQEDPEGQHSRGVKDPYTPRKMADYATNHGRVKGSGTDGTTMMNDLAASFPGYEGHDLGTRAGAVESLRNGIPVAFLGHDMHGTRADGTDTKYGGHYMLLNGVSDDGKKFDVHDGGRNSSRNIRSVTDRQLNDGAVGYWNVSHSTH